MAVAVVTAVIIRPLPAIRVPDAQAFFNEAEAYRQHGDFVAAARWYEAALDEFPGYCDAGYNLARIHTEILPDPTRVVEVLRPLATECGEDVGIRRLLGLALCASGSCSEGIEHLRFVAARMPASDFARRDLEWARKTLDNETGAVGR